MTINDRFYANLLVQIFAFAMLAVYTYVTYAVSVYNVYCLLASVLLFAYGWFRKPAETLIICLGGVIIYAGFVIYRFILTDTSVEIGWNELMWLFIFPAFAMLGGINRSTAYVAEGSVFSFLDMQSAKIDQDGPAIVDEKLGYLSGNAFLYKLEEEVLMALRDRRKFYMLLVEIENFREFKRMFGAEQCQLILNFIAEWLSEYATDARAQVSESVLSAILTDSDQLNLVQEQLDNRFYEMQLARPRREASVKLRLRYGFSECPTDGIEAKMLLEKAKNELSWGGL